MPTQTSREAYESTRGKRSIDCAKVLETIGKFKGLTNNEIAAMLGMEKHIVAARSNELYRAGEIYRKGRRDGGNINRISERYCATCQDQMDIQQKDGSWFCTGCDVEGERQAIIDEAKGLFINT